MTEVAGSEETLAGEPALESAVVSDPSPGEPTSEATAPQVIPRRVADVLIDILAEAGVRVVFGLPGGAIAPLHDALMDRPNMKVVTARHENGAMFAAAGYARTTGKLGVVLVTSGPGVLNAITGLGSAYCDGLPVLLLAGEVPRALFGRNALQEGSAQHLNIVQMTSHITKLSAEVPSANSAPAIFRRAITTAMSGRRGPVLLTLPLDVTSAAIAAPRISSSVTVTMNSDTAAIQPALSRAALAMWNAKRPAILAGSGVRGADGPAELRRLAEKLQVPVMTTPKAKGVFPESHPLSLGVFGHGGHASSSSYLEDGLDSLLVVGSGLSDPATDGWSELLKARENFIQVDADLMQIGRNYAVTEGIVAYAAGALRGMTAALPDETRPARQFGVHLHDDPSTLTVGPEGRLPPQRALWELQLAMPRNTIFTSDIGEHLLFATHYLRIDDPQAFMIMTGLASMATSIPAAMGAKIGHPDRPVVAICGDGAFTMGFSDVATAVIEKQPMVIAVLNDFRYGMVENGHEAVYGRKPGYGQENVDIAEMARAVGAKAFVINKAREILTMGLNKLIENGPVVLDIRIDRQVKMGKNNRNLKLRLIKGGLSLN